MFRPQHKRPHKSEKFRPPFQRWRGRGRGALVAVRRRRNPEMAFLFVATLRSKLLFSLRLFQQRKSVWGVCSCRTAAQGEKVSPAFFKRRRDPRAAPLDALRRARNPLRRFFLLLCEAKCDFLFAPVSAKKKRLAIAQLFRGCAKSKSFRPPPAATDS